MIRALFYQFSNSEFKVIFVSHIMGLFRPRYPEGSKFDTREKSLRPRYEQYFFHRGATISRENGIASTDVPLFFVFFTVFWVIIFCFSVQGGKKFFIFEVPKPLNGVNKISPQKPYMKMEMKAISLFRGKK